MDVETTKTHQRRESESDIGHGRDISKSRRAFLQVGHDRLEVAAFQESPDVARLLKKRIDLAALQCAVARPPLIEADLLDFKPEMLGCAVHVDPLHGAFTCDVGNGRLTARLLGVSDE